MLFHCKMVIFIFALTLDCQVYTGKIFGGHKVTPHSRPYMVLLEQHSKDVRTKHCGGFLLNENFVMTAAHCQAESYTVLLGLDNVRVEKDIQKISAEQSFPHEDYSPTELKNDIMLIKLKSKAHFNKNVRPITFADQDNGSLPQACSVSGWGRSSKKNRLMTPQLMEVNVTLIHNEWCVREKLYCSKGERGPAEGDSGGPLVCENGKAYGVVSASGELNLDGSKIYCFTKIPPYGKWINSIIGGVEKMNE